MKRIALTRGKVALVDDSDYESINRHKWQANYDKKYDGWFTTRCCCCIGDKKGRTVYMSRQITSAPHGSEVDHADHNGLNNQRYNLRVCTRAENQHNQLKHKKRGTSQYKGVYWDKQHKKWRAKINCNQKYFHLGRFDSEIAAARAYDAAAVERFGEFACLNFPTPPKIFVGI